MGKTAYLTAEVADEDAHARARYPRRSCPGPGAVEETENAAATIEKTLDRVPTLMGDHLLARRWHIVDIDAGKLAGSPKPKAITLILVLVGVM